MEQRVRDYAFLSVMRGCGFGMIAIVMTMLALGEQPVMSLQFGGIALLLMSFVLILKAMRAHAVPLRSTEVWIMMPPDDRPPEPQAAGLIAAARQEALVIYAYRAACAAAALLAMDLALIALS